MSNIQRVVTALFMVGLAIVASLNMGAIFTIPATLGLTLATITVLNLVHTGE